MKFGTKFILINSTSVHKQPTVIGNGTLSTTANLSPHRRFHHHRLWILALLAISTFAFIFFTRISTTIINLHPKTTIITTSSQFSSSITDALLYYATANTADDRMKPGEITSITTVLRNCQHLAGACNLLVFGLTHETLLWHFLNYQGGVLGGGGGSRTVFVDENEYRISGFENTVPGFVGYDVRYTTNVSSLRSLISESRRMRVTDCRPVQNLLFSDCPLAINDLPNHMYEIPWDVIIVDGPGGYSPESPGRMSVIFTAGVLARSITKPGSKTTTHVFVHEYGREAERVSCEEFLCKENLVQVNDDLAHFVISGTGGGGQSGGGFEFCREEKNKNQGKTSELG